MLKKNPHRLAVPYVEFSLIKTNLLSAGFLSDFLGMQCWLWRLGSRFGTFAKLSTTHFTLQLWCHCEDKTDATWAPKEWTSMLGLRRLGKDHLEKPYLWDQRKQQAVGCQRNQHGQGKSVSCHISRNLLWSYTQLIQFNTSMYNFYSFPCLKQLAAG